MFGCMTSNASVNIRWNSGPVITALPVLRAFECGASSRHNEPYFFCGFLGWPTKRPRSTLYCLLLLFQTTQNLKISDLLLEKVHWDAAQGLSSYLRTWSKSFFPNFMKKHLSDFVCLNLFHFTFIFSFQCRAFIPHLCIPVIRGGG